jgi:hypothetical protein
MINVVFEMVVDGVSTMSTYFDIIDTGVAGDEYFELALNGDTLTITAFDEYAVEFEGVYTRETSASESD